MANKEKLKIKFRSGLSVGAASAEDDLDFLRDCFVDSGYTQTLLDTENSRSIIVARTGAGKSALIAEVRRNARNVIEIEPDQLAFTYIANSDILRFFENLGVNLDLFYQLLWRHVFCIELIKMRYHVRNEADNRNVFERLTALIVRDQKRERALRYLEQWGEKFWLDTDVRIKEITQKIESQLKASADGLKLGIPLSVEYLGQMGTEIKKELLQRSQKVINEIQIKELHEIINLLADEIFDCEENFYILIDDLDREWAFDPIRYKLIRGLIETIKKLRRIRRAKIIAAIRTDLLDKVISETIDAGFQQEKYEDSYLRLQWTERELKSMLDKRVNHLFRSAYTKDDAQFSDLFPVKYHSQITTDYMMTRTQLRPRDLIIFVNECLMGAAGNVEMSQTIIHDAEVRYSRGRLKSAYQEWTSMYPHLETYASLLKGKKARFMLSDLSISDLSEFALRVATASDGQDAVSVSTSKLIESGNALSHVRFLDFLSEVVSILQRVGFVGVKLAPQESIIWSHKLGAISDRFQLQIESRIYVHPMYWISLGVIPLTASEFD